MTRLNVNTTPAERLRGAVFGERFVSQAEVEANGGTLFGSATADFGLTLGATGYARYDFDGDPFNSFSLTGIIDFVPDFDTDDDNFRYLFDSSSSNRYFIVKNANSVNNTIQIHCGGTTVLTIAEANYSPYWLVG